MTAPPASAAPLPDPLLPPLGRWLAEGAQLPDWLTRPHMARRASVPVPPSFAAQMDSAVRQALLSERILRRDPFTRLARRRSWSGAWLAEHGHPVPAHLAGPFPLQDLPRHLEGLEAGVIKPVHATNAWGVFPFRRSGPFALASLFDRRDYSYTALLETLHAPMQRYMFPNRWQIEELLLPPDDASRVPDDFKAYAFAGAVPLILQVRRGPKGNRYRFHDSDWQPVDTGKYPDATDPSLPPPRDPDALTALAQAISRDLPAPFCRIDLFETTRGPVVGELTPEPGGYQNFNAATDAYLGVFHELALTGLLADRS